MLQAAQRSLLSPCRCLVRAGRGGEGWPALAARRPPPRLTHTITGLQETQTAGTESTSKHSQLPTRRVHCVRCNKATLGLNVD